MVIINHTAVGACDLLHGCSYSSQRAISPMAFAQQQAYPQFGVHPAAMPHASTSEDKTNLVSECMSDTQSLRCKIHYLSV